MVCKSAMRGVLEVVEGVFAPGHLGELTGLVPVELVDAVVAETGTGQRRVRLLPSRVGVYLLLAAGLFPQLGLALVWEKLRCGCGGWGGSAKALRDVRRRLGVGPLRALFEAVSGPLADPRTPGVCYRGYRTVAFDGCASTKVPDSVRNRGVFSRTGSRWGAVGYPMLMLMTLVETGSRGLIGAVFGSGAVGEIAWAGRLVGLLDARMLVLADRGFDAEGFLVKIAGSGAQFLVRVRASRCLPVLARLDDGSYLTLLGGLRLRVLEARVSAYGVDGSCVQGGYRLVTTLLDHRTDPAGALVALYHERWEIESAYYAIRHTLLRGRVLRSKDPAGIEQEMWAILTVYQLLRTAILDAAAHSPGLDPDRLCFTRALEAARDSVILGDRPTPWAEPGRIARAVLAEPLPPRRARYSARKVKAPGTRYSIHDDDQRPLTSTRVTRVEIEIIPLATDAPLLILAKPATGTPTRRQVLEILHQHPGRALKVREIATALGLTGRTPLNRLGVRISTWARQGHLTKTDTATYTLTKPSDLTPTQNP